MNTLTVCIPNEFTSPQELAKQRPRLATLIKNQNTWVNHPLRDMLDALTCEFDNLSELMELLANQEDNSKLHALLFAMQSLGGVTDELTLLAHSVLQQVNEKGEK